MIMNKKKRLRIRERSKSNKQYIQLYYKNVTINSVTFNDKNFVKYVVFNDVFVYAVFRFILKFVDTDCWEFQRLQSLLNDVGLSIEKKQTEEEPEKEKTQYDNFIMKFLKNLNEGKYR
jgi:hypothetical protein